MRFEWDPNKAALNEEKHGVSFREASTAFADTRARIHDDPDHSVIERREIIVGRSGVQRILLVVFTQRGDVVRIISARRASRKERQSYEEDSETRS
jgi:uncharacterized protein